MATEDEEDLVEQEVAEFVGNHPPSEMDPAQIRAIFACGMSSAFKLMAELQLDANRTPEMVELLALKLIALAGRASGQLTKREYDEMRAKTELAGLMLRQRGTH